MLKKKYNNQVINTLIGSETEFKGILHSQGSICIEGDIEGEVYAQGEVKIGVDSCIKGNVFAKRVIVAGEVNGNIEASQGVKIAKTGRVYGDLSGDRLIVEEGGVYKGRVNMDVIASQNMYEGAVEIARNKG